MQVDPTLVPPWLIGPIAAGLSSGAKSVLASVSGKAIASILPRHSGDLQSAIQGAFLGACHREFEASASRPDEHEAWDRLQFMAETLLPVGTDRFPTPVLNALVAEGEAELRDALWAVMAPQCANLPSGVQAEMMVRFGSTFMEEWRGVLSAAGGSGETAFRAFVVEAIGSLLEYTKALEGGAGLAEAIERLEELARQYPVRPLPEHALVNVPGFDDDLFIERRKVFDALDKVLSKHARAYLTGAPGAGKTYAAHRYVVDNASEYSAVYWARGETVDAYRTSMGSIADRLGLPRMGADAEGRPRDISVERVLGHLNANPGWLLVLDNADEPALLDDLLPAGASGKMLFTARPETVGNTDSRVEMGAMSEEDGALLFLRRAGALSGDQALEDAAEADRKAGVEISRKLGGLPLAIDQAGAYVSETGKSPTEFAAKYDTLRAAVLKKRGHAPSGHDEDAFTTFWLAFDQLEMELPIAAQILSVCAMLEPDDIPETIFTSTFAAYPPAWDEIVATGRRLRLLGLKDGLLSIHRVTQATLLEVMDEAEIRRWAEAAIDRLIHAFPEKYLVYEPGTRRLLPHLLACAGHSRRFGMESPKDAFLLNQAGFLLQAYGDYAGALPLYQRALAIFEKQSGPEHPDTAASLNNLAALYDSMGNYTPALPLYERALAIREKALGAEHDDTAVSLNNLALLHKRMGDTASALPLYERALAIREKLLGAEHRDTAASLNNLAGVYYTTGEYERALPLVKRALANRERALGPEHPDTAASLNSLAELYRTMGDNARALPLFKRALAIREKALGAEHPDTATSLNNLAGVYFTSGAPSRALPLYERALEIDEKALGPEHPTTKTVRANRDACRAAMALTPSPSPRGIGEPE